MRTILVTGATGKQGGSVSKTLLAAGFHVRAFTRNASSDRARHLQALGAELAIGSFNNAESVRQAVQGAEGVFSVQNYWESGTGFDGEIRQATTLAKAAKDAGVGHFVQSTMATAVGFSEVSHFQSKRRIEEMLSAIAIPHTLLGTVYFMENLLDRKMGGKMTFPTLAGTLRADTALHLLSVDDIGPAVRDIFNRADQFMGRRVDLAGDQRIGNENRISACDR